MKKKILFVTFVLLSLSTISQTIYYDAIELKKYIVGGKFDTDPNKQKEYAAILKKYCLGKDTISRIQSVFDEYKHPSGNPTNPFIKQYIVAGGESSVNEDKLKTGVSRLLNNVGGLNVTNFADGLAKFMVERMKQELSVAFFQKFQEEINSKDELKALFPATLKVLNTIDKEIYMYEAYIMTLREAFVKDLTNLYYGFKEFKKIPKYAAYFNAHKEIKTLLTTSFYIIDQYARKVHPGKAFADFNADSMVFSDSDLQINMQSSIKVAQLFSESFKSKSGQGYWVPEDSIATMFGPEGFVLRNLYLGLIYQQSKDIKFKIAGSSVPFSAILEIVKNEGNSLLEYQTFIETMVSDFQEIDEYINELKGKTKSEIDYNDYYKIYNASLDLFDDGFKIIDLPHIDINNEEILKQESNRWLYVARTAGELYVDVRTKNYSSAVLNLVSVLDTLLPLTQRNIVINKINDKYSSLKSNPEFESNHDKIMEILKKYENRQIDINKVYSDVSAIFVRDAPLQTQVKDYVGLLLNKVLLESNKQTISTILKYGTFAATIATAQNSDDVKKAIEAIALPVGSASIKRNTDVNISLNGYIGINAGLEHQFAQIGVQNAFSAGLFAPVGLSFSRGNLKCKEVRTCGKKKKVGNKSLGLFVSLIDVGALASFRMGDDSSAVPSEITLKNIVAPGLYFAWGLGKCPISILLGGQFGPGLRNVSATSNKINQDMYFKVGGAITVDIPFFNLYTKSAQ